MREEPIDQTISCAGIVTISVKGKVVCDYPKAHVHVKASATLTKAKTYDVTLDPASGVWAAEATHKWTVANVPITFRLSIDRADMKHVLAEVFEPKGKKKNVFWKQEFDVFDPFKGQKVEMFAQPAFIEPIKSNADHTYAVGYDDSGKRQYLWPCGGDHDEGERSLGTGEAFEPECDCLSLRLIDPATHGLAGIRYGLDGVCHQATNRVLCTAGLEVNGARGYKNHGWKYLTYTLYGRLGVKNDFAARIWAGIKKGCLRNPAKHPFCQERPSFEAGPLEDAGATSAVISAVEAEAASTNTRLAELYTTLAGGRLTPVEYADRMNQAINTYKDTVARMLGAEVHRRVFQEVAEEEVVVVVPHVAERVFARGVPRYDAIF